MNCIELIDVRKKYKDVWVLRGITHSFEKGKIHGLIGKNGAGKTMLIKIICGLITPTTGSVIVNGKHIGVDVDIPDSVGAIIETPGFLPNISGYKNLQYLAGLSGKIGKQEIEKAMRIVGLDPMDKKHVAKYSLGMRQKLGLAQAIMEDPNVLLLDEPMNGLDAQSVLQIRSLIQNMKSKGKTVLLASHNKTDIEELCDTVCEIDAGIITTQS